MTANDSDNSSSDGGSGGPSIEVILSRSSYRVGESIVGTIRLLAPPTPPPSSSQQDSPSLPSDPRAVFSDTHVFVAGYCRLDPRWHNQFASSEYTKIFQSPAVHYNLQNRRGTTGSIEIDEHCICFWSTNVVNLTDLKERTIGRWDDVKPKPIIQRGGGGALSSTADATTEVESAAEASISSTSLEAQDTQAITQSTHTPVATASSPPLLEERQLTFTFRAELPIDTPHSVRATSCRYFYAVMVATHVHSPSSMRKQWLRHGAPIQVLSLRPDDPQPPARLPRLSQSGMGSLAAMAHSAGLPSHVTATDLHQPTGQILVNRRGTASLGALVVPNSQCRRNPDAANIVARNLQTMRITDLQGIPCCVLTIMGVSVATPGSRMVLKFDFPTPRQQPQQQNDNNDDEEQAQSWTPCYHVSASLEGQEVSRFVDGSQKRAQAYQFDTAHEMVDPECTERACLSLLVPLHAPTAISTDIIEVSATCSIDITVGSCPPGTTNNSTNNQQQNITYSNLRLALPCRIVNSISEYEMILSGEDMEEDEDDVRLRLPLDELILGYHRSGTQHGSSNSCCDDSNVEDPPLVETEALRNAQDSTHPSSFVTKDIRQDLKILSLRMANECDLIQ